MPFKNRFFYLLVALVGFFVINPFVADTPGDLYLLGALFSILLLVSVYVIDHKRTLWFIAIFLAALALIGHWVVSIFNPAQTVFILDYVITIIFFILITVTVLAYVIEEKIITASTLYGAICGYLLIGLTWTFIYLIILVTNPEAFKVPPGSYGVAAIHLHTFLYYSFVTLTTLGYGDITPLSNPAKTFAWMEAVVGQIYLTVWIAQLVGLHIARKSREDRDA